MLLIELFLLNVAVSNGNVHNSIYSYRSDKDLKEPAWVYGCDEYTGCKRTFPDQNSTIKYYESEDFCRSMCDPFGGIWPKPKQIEVSSNSIAIHPNNIRYDLLLVPNEVKKLLVEMINVFTRNLLEECRQNITESTNERVVVKFRIRSQITTLSWETNEEYTLDVQVNGGILVVIEANTIFGARHALETLSQLVSSTSSKYSNQVSCGLRLMVGAKIRDSPAYPHRGLVLDTSRHFIPLALMKKTIDAMATTKMNVFHWHMTDSHSFPFQSPRVPQLSKYGAYSSTEMYTFDEVIKFIQYALVRGIKVVIEIDSPAHAGNGWQWGEKHGYGELAVCVNDPSWRTYCVQPPCGQLNPANPAMYDVLKELYKDLADVLTAPALLHMGGDEVKFACWNSSSEIREYMNKHKMPENQTGFFEFWAEFHVSAVTIWNEVLKEIGVLAPQPVMLWSSSLTRPDKIQQYLDKSRYIIEVWEPTTSTDTKELLGLGYRVVAVPKDVWYLDRGFWGNTKYSNWQRMYSYVLPHDPNMLGGEVAMFTEYFDEHNLEPRIWPRAAAVAERLWSDPNTLPKVAEARMERLRNRLITRGLHPDAIAPEWCSQNDNHCQGFHN